MKAFSTALFSIIALTHVGCDRVSNLNSGPVAVVDLDLIAQRIGKDKQILHVIQERQVILNEQMFAAQKSLLDQLNQKKSEFGEISDEEAKQLVQLQKQANSILANTQSQAQTNLTTFQQELINRFRYEVKPIAMDLAKKKGCRVVLSKNDSVVFAFDAAVDLTEEIVARLQTKGASQPSSQTAAKGTHGVSKQAIVDQQARTKR